MRALFFTAAALAAILADLTAAIK